MEKSFIGGQKEKLKIDWDRTDHWSDKKQEQDFCIFVFLRLRKIFPATKRQRLYNHRRKKESTKCQYFSELLHNILVLDLRCLFINDGLCGRRRKRGLGARSVSNLLLAQGSRGEEWVQAHYTNNIIIHPDFKESLSTFGEIVQFSLNLGCWHMLWIGYRGRWLLVWCGAQQNQPCLQPCPSYWRWGVAGSLQNTVAWWGWMIDVESLEEDSPWGDVSAKAFVFPAGTTGRVTLIPAPVSKCPSPQLLDWTNSHSNHLTARTH